jgi:hypothetical protein
MSNAKQMFKLITIIVALFAILVYPVYSQEETDEITKTGIIASLEITGLTRTKLHVVEYHLERFLGLDRSVFDQNEVIAAIKNMGVLEPVSVELVEIMDELVLHVTVEEKWSIFPLPLVLAGSGGTIFGLFFIDSNAFGLADMAVLGASYGSYGWSAIAMYNHTPKQRRGIGWNFVFFYNRHDSENVDRYERIQRVYTFDRMRLSLGLNHNFSDLLSGSVGFAFTDISLGDDNNFYNPPDNGEKLFSFNPGLSLRHSSWDGYFLNVRNISLEYNFNLAIHGSSFHQVEFRGNYEYSFVPGFRASLRSAGVWKTTLNPLFEEGPQRAQVSILPRNYSALNYLGFSAGLEKYLYTNRFGTLSLLGSWQGVFSCRQIEDLEFDHGPSCGVVFYLSRVALPAIGTNISYNMVSGIFQFSFSMGMSF